MDVFSSALKNPVPPTRRKLDHQGELSSKLNSPDPGARFETMPMHPNVYIEATPPNNSQYPLEHDSIDNRKKNSRRRHRNSHLGCGICKKRRIKCDEHLPQCHNCVKGRLHCAYLNLDAPARNALRLAQYNQNLRDERNEDASPKASNRDNNASVIYAQTPGYQVPSYAQLGQVPGEALPGYANSRARPESEAKVMQNPRNQPLAATAHAVPQPGMPPHGQPQIMSPMYVPVVQLQHVNSGMAYTQLPMQMIAGQHAPGSLVYPSEQAQMQMQMQHMPMAPNPQAGAPPIMYHQAPAHDARAAINPVSDTMSSTFMAPIQRPYAYAHPSFAEAPPTQTPDYNRPEIVVSGPKSTVTSPPPPLSSGVPHVTPSLTANSETFVKSASTPSIPSLNLPSSHLSAASGSKEMELPSVGSLSNPTSLGTSPLLPSITSSTKLHSSDPNAQDSSIKLAPIKVEGSDSKHVSSERDAASKDPEKISSIKMLLS